MDVYIKVRWFFFSGRVDDCRVFRRRVVDDGCGVFDHFGAARNVQAPIVIIVENDREYEINLNIDIFLATRYALWQEKVILRSGVFVLFPD